jgi:hypothetical protein
MKLTRLTAHVGMDSPWGIVDHVTPLATGIALVSTPGHGGIWLDQAHAALMPAYMATAYSRGQFWEEDVDWILPALVFADELRAAGDEDTARLVDRAMTAAPLVHQERYARLQRQGDGR